MAKENRILFVEGPNDEHTIYALCTHYEVIDTFKEIFIVGPPDKEGKINRKAKTTELGGIEKVLKAAELNLIAGSGAIERLGIVIDADQDLNSRWQRVLNMLRKAGYEEIKLLETPDPNGTIIKQDFLPTFGVWIMPDNEMNRGFLETFLTFLVPDPENNKTWQQARKCVAELEEKPFVKTDVDHTEKAEIHTFLAWQKEPGKPFGQAITAKYLQADNPIAVFSCVKTEMGLSCTHASLFIRFSSKGSFSL